VSNRRQTRPSQVRPRPPSGGRSSTPAPAQRKRSSSSSRIPARTPTRGNRLPIPANALLALAVVGLAAVVVLFAGGGLGWAGDALGGAFGGLFGRITATPEPEPTPLPLLVAPTLDAPTNPYTNQPQVTLTGSIPPEFAGDPDVTVKLYVAAGGGAPTEVKEVAVPTTALFTIAAVPLVDGVNDFTATLVAPGTESDPSPVVTYVLDSTPPEIAILSPEDGATVNRDVVEILGVTQELSEVVARNEATGATAQATAEGDGSFSVTVPLATGINGITINVTDPAGNAGSAVLSVLQGSGELAATISASDYRISVASLPQALTVRIAVTDPDGRPLAGATVLFNVTVSGLPPIVPGELTTDESGSASFRTVIPTGATTGSGLITALVSTELDGEVTAKRGILVVD
jgi:hypothetical protein